MTMKALRVAAGVIILLIGGGLALAGGVLSVITGSDDTMQTGYHPATASSRALVARAASISPGAVPRGFGEFTMRIDARSSGKPVFIGVAPAAAVENYLSGAAIHTVHGLDLWPYRLRTAGGQGSVSPPPPTEQSFWVASASGTGPRLTWRVTDGEYRVVIMNTDASLGVATDARYALTVPWLSEIAAGSLVLGNVIAAVGMILLVLAARGRPAPPPQWGVPAEDRRTPVPATVYAQGR